MLLSAILPLASLLSCANAAISILNPTADTVWFTNNTVTMNWTLSDPTADTYLFRAFLSNQDQSLFAGNASIADSSYIVNFVNTTNEQQVFATTPSFKIEQGEMSNTTTMGGPTSSAGIPNNSGIPNSPSTTSKNDFPSASSSSPNAGQVNAVAVGPLVQVGAVLAVALAGMGLVL